MFEGREEEDKVETGGAKNGVFSSRQLEFHFQFTRRPIAYSKPEGRKTTVSL